MVSISAPITIDLAAALGESFALPPAGIPLEFLQASSIDRRTLHPLHGASRQEPALLSLVSTGYVACGAHAGDALVMGRTVRGLVEQGIAIGALVSYPDVVGFGLLPMDMPDREFEDMVLMQVAALQAIAHRAGGRLSVVKCHGALGLDVSYDERTAQVMARTLYKLDRDLRLVCMAGSPGARVGLDSGVRVVEEAYIDKAYDRFGRLARCNPTGISSIGVHEAVQQFRNIVLERRVISAEGEVIALRADSICLSSDAVHAAAIADAIAAEVTDLGLTISPLVGRANRQANKAPVGCESTT